MPTVKPACIAGVTPPRRAFFIIAMSERRGFEEELTRGTGTVVEEAAPPIVLALRLMLDDARTAGVFRGGTNDEGPAAAAGETLLVGTAPMPLRARRSSKDRWQLSRTDKFLDREYFGAIAIKDSSVPQALPWPEFPVVWCACELKRKFRAWAG